MTFRRGAAKLLPIAFLCFACAPSSEGSAEYVFDRSKLHTIEITVDSSYLEKLATDLNNRVPCTIVYDGETVEGAGVRQKGNTAQELSGKPSFSVKFNEFDPYADLFGLEKILLNDSEQDPTFLREALGADTFTRAGIPAARITHGQLKLNGEDHGIYVVAEAVDGDFLERYFGKDNKDGNLYEGPCCGDFVDNVAHMELDDEVKDGRSRDDLIALSELIKQTPDATFEEEIALHLDLEGFLKSYALEALLGHWDGYAYRGNNFYMYDNPSDSRFIFIPHGMDRILEDAHFDTETPPIAKLASRILAIPSLEQELHQHMASLMGTAFQKDEMLVMVDQVDALLHTAKQGTRTNLDLKSFASSVATLRDTVVLRDVLLDPSIVCGDGLKAGLETCDDGNLQNGDGCSGRCRVEP